VAVELQRSTDHHVGALLVVVVAGSFVTADGLDQALGRRAGRVLTTVVRALLVPSTMRLLVTGIGGCHRRCGLLPARLTGGESA
jgi:hypothetical protein